MIAEWAITAAVPVILTVAGFGYRSYSKRQNGQDESIRGNTTVCNDIKLDVATIQADVRNIREDISESKKTQTRIFDKIDELKSSGM